MLTRAGWLALAGGAALIVAGRLLGLLELFVLGAGVLALVGVSLLLVHLSRLRLEVAREVHPARVHAGAAARVEVRATNLGRRRTPVLRLRDPVSGTGGATLQLAPLASGASAAASYRLPTSHRGVIELGPLGVEIVDPFGLASVRAAAAGAGSRTELTVLPHVDQIPPLPETRALDPHAGSVHPKASGRAGDDFYALRPYVVGDDLRRVHWRSTAHHDELLVRQDELPWQARTTVLLDVRRAAHTPASLELAVSAAASVVAACWRRRDLVRFVATDGVDVGFAEGQRHVDAIVEHLATLQASDASNLRATLGVLARSAHGGALVAIVARAPASDLDAIARLRSGYGSVSTVVFEPTSWDPTAREPAPRPAPGADEIRVRAGRPFPDAWRASVLRARPAAVGAVR
ncbi:MAG: DUF58 domain-containing protein [Acidimicrobiales bacterium]|nr:DUF58 domain-containing protein [Acidimicrobiales bacterium]